MPSFTQPPLPGRQVRVTPMKTGRKLRSGAPGTKKLLARYGDDLVCVRYRYDPEGKRKLKTVELIVAETPWQPATEKIPLNQMIWSNC